MGIGMLFVFLNLLSHQAEGMLVKHYGRKHDKGGMFFSAIMCLFAMIYFFISDKGGLQFPKGIVVLGLINSTMYAIGFYAGYMAFKTGSFGLTRLFTSFGIIISTLYGIVFLHEPASALMFVAIALILLSLFLINYTPTESNQQKISMKWILAVVSIIISNSAIAIIGRVQYGLFDNTYKNEFLIISFAGAIFFLVLFGLIFERDCLKPVMKYGVLYGGIAGIFNGISNVLTLITYKYLPISITSPARAGLGITLSFITSILIYRESFNKRQFAGAAIGILAVVLMNL